MITAVLATGRECVCDSLCPNGVGGLNHGGFTERHRIHSGCGEQGRRTGWVGHDMQRRGGLVDPNMVEGSVRWAHGQSAAHQPGGVRRQGGKPRRVNGNESMAHWLLHIEGLGYECACLVEPIGYRVLVEHI